MPKILPDLGNRLLDATEYVLRTEGYDALTVARVAAACDIAVGTLYNYFPGKVDMVAAVISRDWHRCRLEMEGEVRAARDFPQGLEALRECIWRFARTYFPIWDQFAQQEGSHRSVTQRHLMLRQQIAEAVAALCGHTGRDELASAAPMLAECVLAAVMQPDMDGSTLRDFAELLK